MSVLEEIAHAARIGLAGDDAEAGGGVEVLGHRAPQIPDRLDRGHLLGGDEGLGIEPGQFAELAQELGRRMQPDRRLQIGLVERLAELAAEFAVEADVDVGVAELRHVGDVGAEREDEVDLAADAFDQAADLVQVGRHVEGAVDRPDDVDARLCALGARCGLLRLLALRPEFLPQPGERAVGDSATGPRRSCAAGSA